MMQPNWFDKANEKTMERASAEECLAQVSKDQTIVKAVREALASHDDAVKKPKYTGPTRTQVIRNAIATTLQSVS